MNQIQNKNYWNYHIDKSDDMYLIYTHPQCQSHSKIVSFDLDQTLIQTKSGKLFGKDANDWKWLNDKVVPQLQQEVSNGCKIVIFSNQNGLLSNGLIIIERMNEFIDKIEQISKQLEQHNVFIQVFVALECNLYRKPTTGMWKLLEQNNNSITIQKEVSIYVGDAAGRIDIKRKNKRIDFGCCDRQFAKNVGITFFTPEEYFEKKTIQPFEWDDCDMKEQQILLQNESLMNKISFSFESSHKNIIVENCSTNEMKQNTKEIILFVGYPCCGKTSFYHKYLKQYEYELITPKLFQSSQLCIDKCIEILQTKSIVIDDTNHEKEMRIDYIILAKELGLSIRCFFFSISFQICHHLEEYQRLSTSNYHFQSSLKSFNKKLYQPSEKEGFSSIIEIPFFIDNDYISNTSLFYSFL